jgi:hypothetical protein
MKISSKDFVHLWSSATDVCDELRNQSKDGRFVSVEEYKPIAIDEKATFAYWFESYAEVLMARQYLESNGHLCQIGLDEWSADYMAAIFTDRKHN